MTQEPTYDIANYTGLTLNPETLSENVQPIHAVNEQPSLTGTTDDKKLETLDSKNILSLRSLVTIKDAGVIIGKGGKNVAEVREITGVRAGVSKVVTGVNERVLTVTGNLDSVAKAYSLFARYLLENSSNNNNSNTNSYSSNFSFLNHFTNNGNHNSNNNHNNSNNNAGHEQITAIHLLISHLLLGSIIGKSGIRIKEIQESSNARIVASKDMLPQSTERIIDIIGTIDSIQIAVRQIGECILNDAEKGINAIQYSPTIRNNINTIMGHQMRNNGYERSFDRNNGNYDMRDYHRDNMNNGDKRKSLNKNKGNDMADVKKIKVPADMVGCIIGRGGKKITEIRNLSGSKITISPVDTNNNNKDGTNEREFTITGTSDNIDQALFLIYAQLDQEKQRRLNNEQNAKNAQNANDTKEPNLINNGATTASS